MHDAQNSTCTACAGTLLLEFGMLTALTGAAHAQSLAQSCSVVYVKPHKDMERTAESQPMSAQAGIQDPPRQARADCFSLLTVPNL